MKMTIKQERKRLWSWTFREGRKVVAGGYCATRADAVNDAGIWKRDREASETPKASIAWKVRHTADKFDSRRDDLSVIDASTIGHPQGPITLATINAQAFAPHMEEALKVANVMASAPLLLNALLIARDMLIQLGMPSSRNNFVHPDDKANEIFECEQWRDNADIIRGAIEKATP